MSSRGATSAPRRLRQRLRGRRMRVGDRHEPGFRMVGGVAPVNAADAAGAQNGDPDHVSPRDSVPAQKFGIDIPE